MGAEYKYYFFSSNCASFLVDLCNSILPGTGSSIHRAAFLLRPDRDPGRLRRLPLPDGRPFLTLLPETYPGLENEAIAASR